MEVALDFAQEHLAKVARHFDVEELLFALFAVISIFFELEA